MGHTNDRHSHHRGRQNDYQDFDLDYGFVFRSPEEVFREFFGANSPLNDIFGIPQPQYNNRRANGTSNGHHHHHHQYHRHSHPQNTIMTSFNPFMGIDDFFRPSDLSMSTVNNGGFSSFSSYNTAFSNVASSGGAVKRTSTSTTFVNGKKLTTKR